MPNNKKEEEDGDGFSIFSLPTRTITGGVIIASERSKTGTVIRASERSNERTTHAFQHGFYCVAFPSQD